MPNPGKPVALKILDGESVNVPPVSPGRPPTPPWDELEDQRVASRAKAEYERLVGLLDKTGALASMDLMTLHAAAVAYGAWRVSLMDDDASAARSWMRLSVQYSSKLGLSPMDRQRIVYPGGPRVESHVLDSPENMRTWGK